jgi:NAD(P)H dehydrogenase (quinone)
MRVLIVYAHPSGESFNAAILDVVRRQTETSGAQVRVIDLYQEGFSAVMTARDWVQYEDCAVNRSGIERYCEDVSWCDTLIFVYPTWWYGLPAILKGWLDRVLVPGLAFDLPQKEGDNIAPGLSHIKRLAVFTTCGASWWLTLFVGAPGKRTLLRGIRLLCAKGCKTAFGAHYSMDSSTSASRANHLQKVARKTDAFLKGRP